VSFARLETDILPLRFRLSGLALLCLAGSVPLRADPNPGAPIENEPAPPRVIVVGAATDSYAYSFSDPKGGVEGFAVDLMAAVTRVMNLQVRQEIGKSRDLQARFARGEFDCLQSYSFSPSHEAIADLSVPYLTLQGAVYVRRGGSVRQFDDLNRQPFAVVGHGTEAEDFLTANHLQVTLVEAASAEAALRKVAAGECAGTFLSRLTALGIIYRQHLTGLIPLGDPLDEHPIRRSFAVHKGDARLLAQLNEGLAIVYHTGEYDRIYRRWFGEIPAPFTHRQLVLYAVTALALALIGALGAAFWQRSLRQRIARQSVELAGQRALLQALYDHIPIGMTVLEMATAGPRLISMNREAGRLYELDPRAVLNRLLSELPMPEGSRRHFLDVLSRQSARGEIVHYEYEFGQMRRVLEVTLISLEAGESTPHLCVLAEDISARKLLDAEIAQTRKLRAVGELVGGIAHEFNNLLTPMILKVGEIQMDWSGDARLQREIAVIAQAAQRATELTRRLLTFGRKSEARADAVQLAELVSNCFELLRPGMDRRLIWESRIPTELPPLRFNATELNQILINLLLNARDTLLEKLALPHDDAWVPLVRVSAIGLPAETATAARPRGGVPLLGWVRLTVRDNGMGIPPNIGERIFEPFFTTKEVGKGTGLGLATVWHLITEAGGRVEMDSQPGTGSAFHVLLPIWPGTEAPAKPIPTRAAVPATARVLLIEDESLVAQTVQAILRRGGHAVNHIANGVEAWQHLAADSSRYDLLIVDVNLPGLNGVDLVGRVRSGNFSGRILVISGRVSASDLRALVQLHVDRVLTKPFTAQQFEAALSESLG
jgi:two-component system cell cycle sensor histidine kinase/response regulator CckA